MGGHRSDLQKHNSLHLDQLISTEVLLQQTLDVRLSCVVPGAQQYLQAQGATCVLQVVLRHISKRAELRHGTNPLFSSGCGFYYFEYVSQIFRGLI